MLTLGEEVQQFKRSLIEQTLRQVHGNRSHAARLLGLERTYLCRLIRRFRIDVPPLRIGHARLASVHREEEALYAL